MVSSIDYLRRQKVLERYSEPCLLQKLGELTKSSQFFPYKEGDGYVDALCDLGYLALYKIPRGTISGALRGETQREGLASFCFVTEQGRKALHPAKTIEEIDEVTERRLDSIVKNSSRLLRICEQDRDDFLKRVPSYLERFCFDSDFTEKNPKILVGLVDGGYIQKTTTEESSRYSLTEKGRVVFLEHTEKRNRSFYQRARDYLTKLSK